MPYSPTAVDRVQRSAFAALLALPLTAARRLAGRPHVVDGAPLDPQIQLGLRILSRLAGPDMVDLSVEHARLLVEQEAWIFGGPQAHVGQTRDLVIPGPDGGVPARLHRPAGRHTDTLPLLIWFHGGGWVVGSIDSHEPVARALCRDTEVAVLNVGYRLAPEHPFPAAFDDALAAFRWAHSNAAELGVDPARIAVGGDSAGGNLSAAVSLAARDGGPVPAFQLLIVPAVDLVHDSASFDRFADGYFLTRRHMDWYKDHYLPRHEDRHDPRASPLLADDLSGLPPAYIAVAGFDPLRDEGRAYAARLRSAGVPVTLTEHRSAVHPFINTLITPMGRAALADAVGALRVGLRV